MILSLERTTERAMPRLDWRMLGLVALMKLALLIYGALSYQIWTNQRLTTLWDAVLIWLHWDTPHYLNIAEHGYQATGLLRDTIVFFPLYPWLVRVVLPLTGDVFAAALIVSTIASFALSLIALALYRLDAPLSTARMAVLFLLIFPTSYFLHIAYTESLFLALLLGAFWAARTRRWLLAGVLGALVGLTRVNGLILVPALLVEAWLQQRADRRWSRHHLWIALVPLGFAGYLLTNYVVTGDPLRFLDIQRARWDKSLTWPWAGIATTLESIEWRSPAEAQMVVVQEVSFIVIGLIATIASAIRLRPSYTVWMLGNWLLFTSTSFILSTPRYTITLFPLFLLMARLGQSRSWHTVITVWSILLLALFSALFVQGRWAF
jgi:hypothetical protein